VTNVTIARHTESNAAHDGVVLIKSVDGLGHPVPKKNTY
jgi:hypothetical protein